MPFNNRKLLETRPARHDEPSRPSLIDGLRSGQGDRVRSIRSARAASSQALLIRKLEAVGKMILANQADHAEEIDQQVDRGPLPPCAASRCIAALQPMPSLGWPAGQYTECVPGSFVDCRSKPRARDGHGRLLVGAVPVQNPQEPGSQNQAYWARNGHKKTRRLYGFHVCNTLIFIVFFGGMGSTEYIPQDIDKKAIQAWIFFDLLTILLTFRKVSPTCGSSFLQSWKRER